MSHPVDAGLPEAYYEPPIAHNIEEPLAHAQNSWHSKGEPRHRHDHTYQNIGDMLKKEAKLWKNRYLKCLVALISLLILTIICIAVLLTYGVEKTKQNAVAEASASLFSSVPFSCEMTTSGPPSSTSTPVPLLCDSTGVTSNNTQFCVPVATDVASVPLPCEPNNEVSARNISTGSSTYNFRVDCGTDIFGNHGPIDLIAIIAYSLDDCLVACIGYNKKVGPETNDKCVGVTMLRKVPDFVQFSSFNGNCFLKN